MSGVSKPFRLIGVSARRDAASRKERWDGKRQQA